jgi:hypothetical protein
VILARGAALDKFAARLEETEVELSPGRERSPTEGALTA